MHCVLIQSSRNLNVEIPELNYEALRSDHSDWYVRLLVNELIEKECLIQRELKKEQDSIAEKVLIVNDSPVIVILDEYRRLDLLKLYIKKYFDADLDPMLLYPGLGLGNFITYSLLKGSRYDLKKLLNYAENDIKKQKDKIEYLGKTIASDPRCTTYEFEHLELAKRKILLEKCERGLKNLIYMQKVIEEEKKDAKYNS